MYPAKFKSTQYMHIQPHLYGIQYNRKMIKIYINDVQPQEIRPTHANWSLFTSCLPLAAACVCPHLGTGHGLLDTI